MGWNSLRGKAIATLIGVSLACAYGMQTFVAIYLNKDWTRVLEKIGFFSFIVVTTILGACWFLWRALTPLDRAYREVLAGRPLGDELFRKAKNANNRVFPVVLTVEILGFFIAPVLTITIYVLTGAVPYGPFEIPLFIVFNLSIGAMAALQIILLIENQLQKPLEALGVSGPAVGSRGVGLGLRIILAALAPTALAASLFTTAALGYAKQLGFESPEFAARFPVEMLVLAAVCLAWGFGLIWTIAGSVVSRIRAVTARIEEIAAGGGDLTKRLVIARDDEMGALAGAFNRFLSTLESLIGRTRELATSVQGSAGTMTASAEAARENVEHLRRSLQSMGGSAEEQSREVERTREVIEAMAQSIKAVAEKVSVQSSHVEQSSAAVAEMAANIASVSATAAKADSVAVQLRDESSEGDRALKATMAAIKELAEASQSVSSIVATISRIAAQTNLLAMNAAIEAAHAGNAGSGFAVVADEVRKLAESAARSAQEIVTLIKTMAARIATGTALADRASISFEKIRERVEDTGRLVRTIADSMSEQKTGAEELLGSVTSLTEATLVIRTMSEGQRVRSGEMREATNRIVEAAQSIQGTILQESRGTAVLLAVVDQVGQEARKNQKETAHLVASMAEFRVQSTTGKNE